MSYYYQSRGGKGSARLTAAERKHYATVRAAEPTLGYITTPRSLNRFIQKFIDGFDYSDLTLKKEDIDDAIIDLEEGMRQLLAVRKAVVERDNKKKKRYADVDVLEQTFDQRAEIQKRSAINRAFARARHINENFPTDFPLGYAPVAGIAHTAPTGEQKDAHNKMLVDLAKQDYKAKHGASPHSGNPIPSSFNSRRAVGSSNLTF